MELSKRTQKIIATICGAILLGIIIALIVRHFTPILTSLMQPTTTNTQPKSELTVDGSTDTKTTVVEPTPEAKKPTTDTKNYSYTAVAGDSYTLFARDAVQKYAKTKSIQLSSTQALQAEVDLTNNANSPLLDIGQVVTIKQSDIAAVLGATSTVVASDESAKTSSTSTTSKTETKADYTYTAQSGDSYTVLARSAISDYDTKNKLTLTGAQRVAAETTVTTAAGSPELSVGQVVSITESTLKSAVDAAKKLSATQLLYWQPYAVQAGL